MSSIHRLRGRRCARRRVALAMSAFALVCTAAGVAGVSSAAGAFAASAAGPAAAVGAAPSPSPAPLPACAGDLAPFGGAPSASPSPPPVALPPAASAVGGERLARPGLQTALTPGTPPPPAIRATAWVVADLTTGAVLASCNAHVPLAPASTLKVLTAVALIHQVNPSALYTARPEDAAIDGTKAGLVPGSRYTAGNLWHGLLMSSANDCASALAELAGGLPAALARMTQVSRDLGAADTRVANTSGLDAPGQVSSAYDLAVFGRAALADPDITAYLRTRDYPFPAAGTAIAGGSGRKAYQIQNHNRLLYNYPGATGVKNGYTVAAGGSFVGSATRGGRSYVVTILRADTNTWRATAALLDWAFAYGAAATPVGTLPVPGAALTAPSGRPAPQSTAQGTSQGTAQATARGPVVDLTPPPTAAAGAAAARAGQPQPSSAGGASAPMAASTFLAGAAAVVVVLAGGGVYLMRRRSVLVTPRGGPRRML